MALKPVSLEWGPNYANVLELNDQSNYISKTFDLHGGPPLDVIVADTLYTSPFRVRQKLRERPFSMNIRIKGTPYSATWNQRLVELKRALYSGPLHVVVERTGVADMYLDCDLQNLDENGIDFTAKLVASDPIFTKAGALNSATGTTGSSPPYNSLSFPTYVGSAPAEPVVTFTVQATAYVYQYYKLITITNPTNQAWSFYPVCIDLGDVQTWLTSNKLHEVGGGDRRINDIRLETLAGARKQIWLRDAGERGSTWHSSLKIWTVLYSLGPGETKTLRLLYGNPAAPTAEVYPEATTVRPMFNMYTSTNLIWHYTDYMPHWSEPQTRNMQWTAYVPGADNVTWIGYRHPAFNAPNADNVPCAGGRTMYTRPASGAAGIQLATPVPVQQVVWSWVFSGNAKDPFVLRSTRPDNRVVDDWMTAPTRPVLLYARTTIPPGANYMFLADQDGVATLTRGGGTIAVSDGILIEQDDGTFVKGTVTSVDLVNKGFVWSGTTTATVSPGRAVQHFATGSGTISYPSSDRPKNIAFIMRGDHPEANSGGWYFGGADEVDIYLENASTVQVSIGAEVNLVTNNEYQIKGRFGNGATAEYLNISTHMHMGDKIVVDCQKRKVTYYPWDGSAYGPGENRFESLRFESVRQWWIHIDPALETNNLSFVADSDSNFRSLAVTVDYPTRYY